MKIARYHCPYCSPHHQIHKERYDGVLVCSQCGDPLSRVFVIKPTQIIALIAASTFIAPLIILALTIIKDLNEPNPKEIIHTMTNINPEIVIL